MCEGSSGQEVPRCQLAIDSEAATQMALRYEDDDGEMCRLTALTLAEQHGENLRGSSATGGEC